MSHPRRPWEFSDNNQRGFQNSRNPQDPRQSLGGSSSLAQRQSISGNSNTYESPYSYVGSQGGSSTASHPANYPTGQATTVDPWKDPQYLEANERITKLVEGGNQITWKPRSNEYTSVPSNATRDRDEARERNAAALTRHREKINNIRTAEAEAIQVLAGLHHQRTNTGSQYSTDPSGSDMSNVPGGSAQGYSQAEYPSSHGHSSGSTLYPWAKPGRGRRKWRVY
nr:hypothetical protein L203_04336 [Cryptococcus depauperatus CBS 7841]